MQHGRKPFDLHELHEASASGLCFICEFLSDNPKFDHVVVDETDTAIAFLNRFPTLFGYTLVAPKRHVEEVTGDYSEAEYVELQTFIYRVAEAIRQVLAPERVYILSLGSQSANAHVHWHIAPLPPGVSLEHQQYYALMHEHGIIEMSAEDCSDFVKQVRTALGK